jgi:membrane protein DedA with SNARE-associated domain
VDSHIHYTKRSAVQVSRVAANKSPTPVKIVEQEIPAIPVVTESKPRNTNFRTTILRVLAILGVIGITFYTYSIRQHIEQFQVLGYPGIFLIALLANATILLPAPGVAIIYAMGAVFNPIGVGIAAGSGGALGELSGYLAGFSGQAVIERTDVYERTKPWVEKYGGWAIMVLSAIPNPLFDVAGIAAGIAKMPFWTFLFFVWIGQLIKMTLFALAGKYSIDFISNFIK